MRKPFNSSAAWLAWGLGLAGLCAPGVQGAELLTNPGFESGTSGWVGRNCSIAVETTEVNGGTGAVRVFNRTKNWHSVRQDIRTVLLANGPGDYQVKASARAEIGFSGTAKIKFVIVESGTTRALNTPFTMSDAVWTDVSTTRAINWTGTLDQAYFEVPHDTANASYYVDDCSLEPVSTGPNENPVFFSNPLVEANAAENEPYSGTLVDDSFDSDGDTLTFAGLAGPTWLSIATNGDLSGTPSSGDVGVNVFTVEVSDGGTNAQSTLHIDVLPAPAPIALPYTDSFETQPRWAPLWLSQGWDADKAAAPEVIAHAGSYSAGPLPFAVPHDQVLDLFDSTRPVFAPPSASAQVLVDTLVQPSLRTDPQAPATTPDAQAAVFVNGDGYLVVQHKVYNASFTTATQTWSVLTHAPITTGQWVRLAILVDYQSDSLRNHSFFSVSLDTAPLSHANAYTTPGPTNLTTDSNGPWFLCANSGPGTGPFGFSGLELNGLTRLDDLAVSDPVRETSRGTPFGWIDRYYLPGDYEALDQSDSDGDGMKAWEEYRAGTDPTQFGSVFKATLHTEPTGEFRLAWPSSFAGSLAPYYIHRTEDLMDELSWVSVAGPISRDLTGINRWVDPSPPTSPSAYYRITVP